VGAAGRGAQYQRDDLEGGRRSDHYLRYTPPSHPSTNLHHRPVSDYQQGLKASQAAIARKENESAELRRLYAALRDQRDQSRPKQSNSQQQQPRPPPLSTDGTKQILRQALNSQSSGPERDLLANWKQERVVSYYDQPIDTLSLSDIHRWLSPLPPSPLSPPLTSHTTGCTLSTGCSPRLAPHSSVRARPTGIPELPFFSLPLTNENTALLCAGRAGGQSAPGRHN
jgi:hypothetical protein